LAGRTITTGSQIRGFGAVQGQPPLPLQADEYVVSFDDGPNAQTTLQLLKILRSYCIKSTFFLVGWRAVANADLVKAIAAEGHAIGSHSLRHPDLGKLTEEQIVAEMEKGVDAVEKAEYGERRPGLLPRLVRLPGSSAASPVPAPTVIKALQSDGLTVAGYDLIPQDWRNSPPKESFDRLFRNIKDRGVIVFHDGPPNTILLLPMALDELSRRGAKIVALTP
jgi:peptidoglycan/xylan/chitin deacetylase (PgdA/CDA1 family)